MNYKICWDSFYTSIEKTSTDVNGYDVFKTLAECKKEIIKSHTGTIYEYRENIKDIRSLKKSDIQ
jgi:hypothetical protein